MATSFFELIGRELDYKVFLLGSSVEMTSQGSVVPSNVRRDFDTAY